MASNEGEDADASPRERYRQFISSLPLREGSLPCRCYKGIWYPEAFLPGLLAFVDSFEPRDTDIFLLSRPKSGTTWLKALAFSIVHRKDYSPFAQDHPLLCVQSHDCIPLVDVQFGQRQPSESKGLAHSPRMVSMHAAYQLLPESFTASGCKFIYICREPKDTFVSSWHFRKAVQVTNGNGKEASLSEAFNKYCEGLLWPFGAFWDHVLGYWRESLRRPSKILFLKYEDMMEDPEGHVRRMAEFVGCPFSQEEEEDGFVEGIVRLCSFDKLSGLEANRKGDRGLEDIRIKRSAYFRKGKVGDWKNHLTAEMAEKLDRIVEEKLRGSGLSFGRTE